MPLLPAIPGYEAAVAREEQIRDEAFFGVTEKICGVEVVQITSEHVDALQGIESPFFVGRREANENDVAFFFWICSPHFIPRVRTVWWKPSTWIQNQRSKFAQNRVTASLRKINFGEAITTIDKFIDEALMDSPGGNNKKRRINFVSWRANAVGSIASEYGWDDDKIRKLPLKVLWQYQREIRLRKGGTLFNPSDKIRAAWLKERNAPIRAARAAQKAAKAKQP